PEGASQLVTDLAGNPLTPVIKTFAVDIDRPVVREFDLDPNSDTGRQGDLKTSLESPTFFGRATDTFPGSSDGMIVHLDITSATLADGPPLPRFVNGVFDDGPANTFTAGGGIFSIQTVARLNGEDVNDNGALDPLEDLNGNNRLDVDGVYTFQLR